MMKRLHILLSIAVLICALSCTTEEVIFDIDQQFSEDLAEIDQFLASNNISAEVAESGVRYRILNEGEEVALQTSCNLTLRMTVHHLDSTYVFSNYPEVEEENGFEFPFDESFSIQKCIIMNVLEGLYVIDELVGLGGQVQFFVPSRLAWASAGRFFSANSPRSRGIRFIQVPENTNVLITAELIEVL